MGRDDVIQLREDMEDEEEWHCIALSPDDILRIYFHLHMLESLVMHWIENDAYLMTAWQRLMLEREWFMASSAGREARGRADRDASAQLSPSEWVQRIISVDRFS